MTITRRALFAAALPAALAVTTARRVLAAEDTRLTQRAIGNPNAKVTVEEWFSLTCTHCARFAIDVLPQVKTKLIDTGRVRYVFSDFPLDRIALMAAQVARTLPVERYEPFVMSLLANQDRWAFVQDGNPQDQLRKMAGLAGMSSEDFDRAVNDVALQNAILAAQTTAETKYKIDSTPTFRFNEEIYREGEMTYDAFEKKVVAHGG